MISPFNTMLENSIFQNNRLGIVLASVCGALGLLVFGLAIAPALRPITATGGNMPQEAESSPGIATLQPARPLADFAVIAERPVFNETRRPVTGLSGDGELVEEQPEEYAGLPEMEVGGIVITPSLRMATLKTPELGGTVVAFEGEPLGEGFGNWEVSRIDERTVTLASTDGEEVKLELEVYDDMIEAPPEPRKPARKRAADEAKRAPASVANGESGESAESQADSPQAELEKASPEEIRERIEVRREELRKAAEERDAAQSQSYNSEVQSQQQDQEEDENPQDNG